MADTGANSPAPPPPVPDRDDDVYDGGSDNDRNNPFGTLRSTKSTVLGDHHQRHSGNVITTERKLLQTYFNPNTTIQSLNVCSRDCYNFRQIRHRDCLQKAQSTFRRSLQWLAVGLFVYVLFELLAIFLGTFAQCVGLAGLLTTTLVTATLWQC